MQKQHIDVTTTNTTMMKNFQGSQVPFKKKKKKRNRNNGIGG